MKPGEKTLLTPLRREDRGILTDPQFSGYLPGDRYIVFQDYGHPEHLGSLTFRTKTEAQAFVDGKLAVETLSKFVKAGRK
jgi:hypothetical protein